jgi:hypothetical protein
MKYTKEQIRKIAFQSKETWNDKDIDTFIEGFEKALSLSAVSSNEVKLFCRLHSMRKNCREYRNNKNNCKTCPHFVEAK